MKDIIETVGDNNQFSKLALALNSTGLAQALSDGGPYTLFAPTDEAFSEMSQELSEILMDDKKELMRLLKYHVVPGKVTAADVAAVGCAETSEGNLICMDTIQRVAEDTNVVHSDIECSNGFIHAIDQVLVPD